MGFSLILRSCTLLLVSPTSPTCKEPLNIPHVAEESCKCETRKDLGDKIKLCVRCSAQTMPGGSTKAICESLAKDMHSDTKKVEAKSGLTESLEYNRQPECVPAK
jgi:hypothetical protein